VYSTTEFKGSDIVLAALELIKQRIPKLRVIAFGADRPSTKLPLPSWIEFHFRPPQDQIRLLYSKCDVWLCGSRSEGFYLPMLEAMACRCPVVSTRVGGPIDTVMDAVNGFLVEIEDASGLAASTLKVLQLSDADWQLMSDAALLTATHYSWDDAADRLENTLLRLANQHLENSPAGVLRN
jgi:glycosyltransferase involved in cell wall biosynthesis